MSSSVPFFEKNIRSPTFQVKATAGDTHLGGEDFDNRPLVIIYVIILWEYFTNKHHGCNRDLNYIIWMQTFW